MDAGPWGKVFEFPYEKRVAIATVKIRFRAVGIQPVAPEQSVIRKDERREIVFVVLPGWCRDDSRMCSGLGESYPKSGNDESGGGTEGIEFQIPMFAVAGSPRNTVFTAAMEKLEQVNVRNFEIRSLKSLSTPCSFRRELCADKVRPSGRKPMETVIEPEKMKFDQPAYALEESELKKYGNNSQFQKEFRDASQE